MAKSWHSGLQQIYSVPYSTVPLYWSVAYYAVSCLTLSYNTISYSTIYHIHYTYAILEFHINYLQTTLFKKTTNFFQDIFPQEFELPNGQKSSIYFTVCILYVCYTSAYTKLLFLLQYFWCHICCRICDRITVQLVLIVMEIDSQNNFFR